MIIICGNTNFGYQTETTKSTIAQNFVLETFSFQFCCLLKTTNLEIAPSSLCGCVLKRKQKPETLLGTQDSAQCADEKFIPLDSAEDVGVLLLDYTGGRRYRLCHCSNSMKIL